jgi:antitoxin component HigA of HigAB toxin-antitoxin module
MPSIKIDIEDESGKKLRTYIIDKSNVGQAARRFKLVDAVLKKELPENESNQMLNCCALATVLKDGKGELLYPDNDPDNILSAPERIFNEMDYEESVLLVDAYLEMNPLSNTLKAKKKKY